MRLRTRPARGHDDVAAFFDARAPAYAEQHGDAERLLAYRVGLIRDAARPRPGDTVLEIGCGTGLHLSALAAGEAFGRGLGVDLSPAMVAVARERLAGSVVRDRLTFTVDAAERLDSVADDSVDVAFCVGALEHVLDQGAALASACRVVKPGGRLVCLTLNGGSLWYRLAPVLGFDTRRLSTDRYLGRRELAALAAASGFGRLEIDSWRFVQRGDMPRPAAAVLSFLDRVGVVLGLAVLRGGLRLVAVKPQEDRSATRSR